MGCFAGKCGTDLNRMMCWISNIFWKIINQKKYEKGDNHSFKEKHEYVVLSQATLKTLRP